ncbi:acetyltransferase [Breznakia pachnodae]|uniref:Sugar O-acyltransferase (Sialic acid O-acetyltransferase NeuD family) n=1 Tax=Breznakia pachnodae TaxID=265178 RepID=A0ABU0E5L1_9FIRM|nr:acetyltransferase [Breznakia pachnodae]MDQ0362003.1 sugar O-acyltransferase (sialic acid O-acetyltransferase NeuD family) [Breznakia pachnodae]
MKSLLIWGTGDQGLVTLDAAIEMNCYAKIDFLMIKEKHNCKITGYQIYDEDEINLDVLLDSYHEVIVATGDNQVREEKIKQVIRRGVKLATIIHPTAVISRMAVVEIGTTILPNALINAKAHIGTGCIVNTGSIIEHGCTICDYVNVSPNAAIVGNCKIGRKTWMGIGSVVIHNIEIGENVIVGAGSVVIKDIPSNMTVVGIPAKTI